MLIRGVVSVALVRLDGHFVFVLPGERQVSESVSFDSAARDDEDDRMARGAYRSAR